jgi:hypothetical protein
MILLDKSVSWYFLYVNGKMAGMDAFGPTRLEEYARNNKLEDYFVVSSGDLDCSEDIDDQLASILGDSSNQDRTIQLVCSNSDQEDDCN